MVAERCLSASLFVIVAASPHRCQTMATEAMAGDQTFIPTHVVSYEGEVIGDILRDFSCKALLYGQCRMTVGGYVLRGMVLECGKRAKAIRGNAGAFERVNPSSCNVALGLPQPPQPPRPVDDFTLAASSICLAIQEDTPRLAFNLMPELERQAIVEASELPVQEKIQLHESRVQHQLAQQ